MMEVFSDRRVGMRFFQFVLAVGGVHRAVVFMGGVSLEGRRVRLEDTFVKFGWQTRIRLCMSSI